MFVPFVRPPIEHAIRLLEEGPICYQADVIPGHRICNSLCDGCLPIVWVNLCFRITCANQIRIQEETWCCSVVAKSAHLKTCHLYCANNIYTIFDIVLHHYHNSRSNYLLVGFAFDRQSQFVRKVGSPSNASSAKMEQWREAPWAVTSHALANIMS
jgi:hypothetical protein